MNVASFAAASLTYCQEFKASQTSGYRTHAHNLAVGGKRGSPHRFGLADDVTYDELPPLDQAQKVANLLGLEVIREDTHDHIQPQGWVNHPESDDA